MTTATYQKQLERGIDISVIDLVDSLVKSAHESKASDIHIDPKQDYIRVRFRIDGVLQDAPAIPKPIYNEIISRIKILSGLRTDEHASCQDGRFRITLPNCDLVDIRVSIMPTYHGENCVLRLLSDQSEHFALESLGFSEKNINTISEALKKPFGLILATGPTGSGKTTSLYTMVKMLSTNATSIVTIEDPIEYAISDIRQIQVNARSGLTFASGLRSVLRQDPDVIMVGEIRDSETANLAVMSALTGHLVLSTLHTNDAATNLPRLLEMGIEPYLIASTVNIVIGQRLVRKICAVCKQEKIITDAEHASLSAALSSELMQNEKKFFFGKGCGECSQSGYKGRVGVHEVLVVSDEIRDAILRRASAREIKALAIKNGMVTMLTDAFVKAQRGVTTLEEVLRVIHE